MLIIYSTFVLNSLINFTSLTITSEMVLSQPFYLLVSFVSFPVSMSAKISNIIANCSGGKGSLIFLTCKGMGALNVSLLGLILL